MTDRLSLSRRALLAAGPAFAAMSLAANEAVAATRGGRLIYARNADSMELDPVFNDANVDIWVMNSIYETLLAPSADGMGVQPGLATKWAFSADGKTLSLTLREGVKFSNGTPMTAADVKWSLDRAKDPKNGAWNNMVGSIAEVVVVSPTAIDLKLKAPDPTLLAALATFNTGILPGALVDATPGADARAKAIAFAERPIGTGAFMIADWRRGQRMLLVRNPHYWKQGDDGRALPYVDELEFQIIPDDATRILKLKAGEVHGTEFVPYARVAELQADANLRMELWPSTRVSYLSFNIRPTLKDGTANPLSNQKVRHALNLAVNKDAVIAITTRGLGKPTRSFMSSTTPLFHGQPAYPFDLAKAKALLAEAGFANGFDLTCLSVAGNQDNLSNLTTVQQMWAGIGVRLKIDLMDSPSLVRRFRAEDFQMRTAAWTNDIADPGQITSYFAFSPNIGALRSGWVNDRVNSLYTAGLTEIDTAKRAAMYKEIQEIYMDAAPIVFLYETPYPVAFRKNVRGFVQIPLGNNNFEAASIEK